MQQLPAPHRGAVPEARVHRVGLPGQVLAAVDAVPAVPGQYPLRSDLLEQGLPHFLHADEGTQGC